MLHSHPETMLMFFLGKVFHYNYGISYTGKFWQTIQVKAISKENFGKKAPVSAYALVYLCILARKILANRSRFAQFAIFSQPIFSHVRYYFYKLK